MKNEKKPFKNVCHEKRQKKRRSDFLKNGNRDAMIFFLCFQEIFESTGDSLGVFNIDDAWRGFEKSRRSSKQKFSD